MVTELKLESRSLVSKSGALLPTMAGMFFSPCGMNFYFLIFHTKKCKEYNLDLSGNFGL
jgi:hypothetical protein